MADEPDDMVTLFNGSTEPRANVDHVWGKLQALNEMSPAALTELVNKAKDMTYGGQPWIDAIPTIMNVGLLQMDGLLHHVVVNVGQSCIDDAGNLRYPVDISVASYPILR